MASKIFGGKSDFRDYEASPQVVQKPTLVRSFFHDGTNSRHHNLAMNFLGFFQGWVPRETTFRPLLAQVLLRLLSLLQEGLVVAVTCIIS